CCSARSHALRVFRPPLFLSTAPASPHALPSFPTRRSSDLNADGTIPAWTGGIKSAAEAGFPNYKSGDHHPDPYASDKPLFTITRSEEHTSELQSLTNLVCRLLLAKKKHRHDLLPSEHSAHR